MIRRPSWLRWSSRLHLAFGLAALAASALLVAAWLGVVPDAEGAERRHRLALAEVLALTLSDRVDEQDPSVLQATLAFLQERQPELLSIGIRHADGELLVAVADHASHWRPPADGRSTDAALVVPVWQHGQPWGQVELRFVPLRTQGWRSITQEPSLRLAALLFALCTPAFALYLRRMLRELDPSRAVPPRVRAAYDTLTEGLLVLDAGGSIVLANRSAAEMLGVEEASLVARSPDEFAWATEDGRAIAVGELPWSTALARGERQRDVALRVQGRDGRRYALRANCSPILSDRGRAQALVVSFQDVTELEARGEALRHAKEEADAANEAKSRFLANMSHEIRTPMNAILGFTEVLRRGGLRRPAEAARQLDIIHSSGRHLLALINDILDLSKVEAGRLEAERIEVSPHRIAAEVVQTLQPRAAEKSLALRLAASTPLPAVLEADPARLRQILTNLIGNALKFTERGSVTVHLRVDDDASQPRYGIEVEDTGIGIAADKLDAVFEPFVQAESSTTRRFGGTGLGLTISRGFARAMGGDIEVRSTPGQGTVFTLWLPLSAASPRLEPEILLAPVVAAEAVAARRWTFPPKRVLVVDDGVENRQLVRVLLEEVGLVVEEAEHGQAAVERLAVDGIDLVLMDMWMPVMDGLTATRRLRDRGCGLPIVALTANAMKGFEQEIEAAGFSGFLTKPIDVDALLADLAARLGGQEADLEPAMAQEVAPATATGPNAMPTASIVPGPRAATISMAADETPLVSRLAGHPKLGRIVARFVDQLPGKLREMEDALKARDADALAALAHWLKGAGGSMGFDDLFEPSRELEEAARATDHARAAEALDRLCVLARRIDAGRPETQASPA